MEGSRRGAGIPQRDDHAVDPVGDDLASSRVVGQHHGKPAGHRLEHGDAAPLAQAGVKQDVGVLERLPDLGMGEGAAETDAVVHLVALDGVLDPRAFSLLGESR